MRHPSQEKAKWKCFLCFQVRQGDFLYLIIFILNLIFIFDKQILPFYEGLRQKYVQRPRNCLEMGYFGST